MACQSLLQWTTFCQNSPPWSICLGWPYTAWLKVSLSWIRLWSMWLDWLVFCDCGFQVCLPCDGWWWRKRPWCWERLQVGGEGDDRGWDGWMASVTQWTWVWVNSRSWWWTGRPGMLQSIGSQRVRYNWITELNWTGKQVFRDFALNTWF